MEKKPTKIILSKSYFLSTHVYRKEVLKLTLNLDSKHKVKESERERKRERERARERAREIVYTAWIL